ncbi:MAG: acyltransferase [Gammaproteobacteria bacterium]|nr:acyltransferase [Gammaproteobacteria bacterium]
MWLLRPLFLCVGNNVIFDPDGFYSYSTIKVGSDVFIGPCAHFSGQSIIIGNKVLFGPGVYILGGDHQYSVPGKFMHDLKDPGKNLPVIIEDDVWVGANVTILKGVHIGTGSIIGAGSVVTHDVESYTIVAGNPARLLRKRFLEDDLQRHLALLKTQRQ